MDAKGWLLVFSAIGAAFAIAVAAAGASIGQGNAVRGAMDSIGRNPESQSKLMPVLIIGLAFIESLCLYALVVSLILLFANPLIKFLQ
jgi:F-type H+-transporting ATPase subunit c